MSLDIFLLSLSWDEYSAMYPEALPASRGRHPLLCWDLAAPSGNSIYDPLYEAAAGYEWISRLPALLARSFDALILTGSDRTILWTDPGFEQMTGYSNDFARGRKPVFLQGKNTEPDILQKISRLLQSGKPFRQKLTNYRADGSEYLCDIRILPLYHQKNITHYIALENEIICP